MSTCDTCATHASTSGISAGSDINTAEANVAKGADAYAAERGQAYVANNPDLQKKAAEHAVAYAQENPEQAMNMAGAAFQAQQQQSGGGGYGSATAGNPFGGGAVTNAW